MSKKHWPKRGRLTENDDAKEAPQNDGASSVEVTLGDVLEATRLDLRETSSVSRRGHHWQVVVIQEGWSKNNRFYTREALERSIPLWENQDVCAYGYDPSNRNHVPGTIETKHPDGTFLNKVGFLKNVRGQVVEGRYELVADFICTKAELRAELVETLEAEGRLPGFSIHAEGERMSGVREGRSGPVVTEITETKELTLVSNPAAGGRAIKLVAALETNKENKEMKKLRQFLAGRLSAKQPKALAEAMTATVEGMDDKAVVRTVAESLKEMDGGKYMKKALDALNAEDVPRAVMVLELAIEMLEPETAPVEEKKPEDEPVFVAEQAPAASASAAVTESERQMAEFLKRAAIRESQSILKERLAEAKLPKVAEDQIREQFAGGAFQESDLEKAIERANKLLAVNAGGDALIESRGSRTPRAQVLVESVDNFNACLALMVGYEPEADDSLTESEKQMYKNLKGCPQTKSIRRLYQDASGDDNFTRVGKSALNEAVTNTTFSQSLGSAVTLKLTQDFNREEAAPWMPFIQEVENENLLAQERIAIGGIGMLPTVAEAADYTDIGQPVEYKDTYSLAKYGGYYSVTMEAVLNDRIGLISALPQKIRDAALEARDTLAYKLVTGAVGGTINGDLSYDGVAHYSANHGNYATSAISSAAIAAARVQQRKTRVVAVETALDDATDVNTSDTAFVVDSVTGIRPGMYARIDAEYVLVSAVNTGTKTLTVVRAQLGTTAAAHLDNAKIFATSGVVRRLANPVLMYVIVPSELEDAALVALSSQFLPGSPNNDVNTVYADYQAGRIKLVSVDASYLGGDTTNWYTASPWQVLNGLEFGYLGGNKVPTLINETQEQVGQVFLADTMRFKARYFIGGTNFFHEGRTGNIVTG